MAAAHGGGKGIVLEGVAEHLLIPEMQRRDALGDDGFYVGLHIQEGTQGELAGLPVALAVGQGAVGVQHVQLQLQHIILADGTHLPLGLCHFVEFLGLLQVLAGYTHLLACQYQVEEKADGLHRHLLRLGEETGLCLAVFQRLYTAVPLQMVDAEDRLRESQSYRHRHELIATALARLMQEVQRSLYGQRAARRPYLLTDIERTVQA